MVFRASAKFQKHFRCKVDASERIVQPFPWTWNLDLFRHRTSQLVVLASEERSLFSFLLPLSLSRDINHFHEAFKARLLVFLDNIRVWERVEFEEVHFCPRTDRRVIGSQNEFHYIAKDILSEYGGLIKTDLIGVIEEEINATPMSYLDMRNPKTAIWEEKKV